MDYLLVYIYITKQLEREGKTCYLSPYKKGKMKLEATFVNIVWNLYESKNPVLILVDYLLGRVPAFSLSLEAIFALFLE